MDQLLKVTDLTKRFQIAKGSYIGAINGISFELGVGETLGLVGESGSGKTTTGRCILRLVQPTAGSIVYKGRDITSIEQDEHRKLRSEMQLVFQEPLASLNPRRSVWATLEEPLILQGTLTKTEREIRVIETLGLVGLDARFLRLYPARLTSSAAQRVGIGRALVTRPSLVVLDEPTSALDSNARYELLQVLRNIQNNFRTSFLFISHDLNAIRHISHRVAIMYLGRIVETAPTEELFSEQLHPYSRALLSASLPLDPRTPLDPFVVTGEIPSAINPANDCPFYSRCPLRKPDCLDVFPSFNEAHKGHFVACRHSSELKGRTNTQLAEIWPSS